MTFWLFNRLFEDKKSQEERERKADQKRREKIKRKKIAAKKRALEMDKLRDSCGAGVGGNNMEAQAGSDENPYAYNRKTTTKGQSALNDALTRGFGAGPEAKTGYKHNAARPLPPGQVAPQNGPNSGKPQALIDISSKIRRPI